MSTKAELLTSGKPNRSSPQIATELRNQVFSQVFCIHFNFLSEEQSF